MDKIDMNDKKLKSKLWEIKFCAMATVASYQNDKLENSKIFLNKTQDAITFLISKPIEYNLNLFLKNMSNLITVLLTNKEFNTLFYILEFTLGNTISIFLKELYVKYPEEKKEIDIVNPNYNLNDKENLNNIFNRPFNKVIEFRNRLKLSIYEKEAVSCPCGSNKYTIIMNKGYEEIEASQCLCHNCGLIFTNPRLTKESFNTFYQTDFIDLHSNYFNNLDKDQNKRGQEILSFCKNLISEKCNILEIGCSRGGILSVFKENGFNTVGIDIGEESISYGKSKGLELYNLRSIEFSKVTNKKFDLIILSHVFEHFLDIKEELDIIKNLLSKTGLLYIEMPGLKYHIGVRNVMESFFMSCHVSHFNLTTLDNIMRINDFEMLKGNEYIRSLYKFNNMVNKEINNCYFENINLLKFFAN